VQWGGTRRPPKGRGFKACSRQRPQKNHENPQKDFTKKTRRDARERNASKGTDGGSEKSLVGKSWVSPRRTTAPSAA